MMLIKRIILYFVRKLGYDIIKTKKRVNDDMPGRQDIEVNCGEIDKIHYGCGPKYLEGWLNVDLNAQDQPPYFSVCADLTKRHPFPNDQFEFGFAEDFIEHLGQAEQILFLYEVYRTLKKGGVLRLSFPGLEGVLRKHFPDSEYKTATLAKKEAYEMLGHTHFPSFCELELICKTIGFCEVNRVGYGTSVYKELTHIDTREDQIGLNTYVEIIK
jgi:predicted SAM-dependent methyltransferase